jgi:hypothetical protein
MPVEPSRPTQPIRRAVARRRIRTALLAVALPAVVVVGGCSSDGDDDESPVNSVPDSTEAPADEGTPPSSGQEEAPSDEEPDNQGAEPGQDGDQLDPPGGTTPTPDPGGDGDGSSGEGVNPDTAN